MRNILLVMGLLAVSFTSALGQVSPVQVSYLPSARSGEPNAAVTVFGTFANSSDEEIECSIRSTFLGGLPDGVSGQVRAYPVTNGVITGSNIDPIVVPAGGTADFLVAMTVNGEFTGAGRPDFRCVGTTFAAVPPSYNLVNDIYLTIASGPAPDIVMIGDTLSSDGTARIDSNGPRAALMTVAAINIGDATSNLEVVPVIGGFPAMNSAISPTICEVNASGVCLQAEAGSVTVSNWAANEIRLFAIRGRFPGGVGVPFYPDLIRLMAAVRPHPSAADGQQQAPTIGYGGAILTGPTEIARTSTAIVVARSGEDAAAAADLASMMSTMTCDIRPNFDTAGTDHGLENSRIAFVPQSDGSVHAGGFVQTSFFESQPRLQPIGLEMEAPQSFEDRVAEFAMAVFGDGGVQDSDGQLQGQYEFDSRTGGLTFNWDGGSGLSNEFNEAGIMRCGLLPARSNEPGITNGADDLLAGTFDQFDVTNPEAAEPSLANVLHQTYGDHPESIQVENRDTLIAWVQQQAEFGEVNAGDAFIAFFGVLESDGYHRDGVPGVDPVSAHGGGLIGYAFPGLLRDDNGTSRADCVVVTAYDQSSVNTARDAEVYLAVRDGADLDAAIESCIR